jgi:hypothetical protein
MNLYRIVRHPTKLGFATVGLDDVFYEESALVLANRIVHKAKCHQGEYVILLEGIEMHWHRKDDTRGVSVNTLCTPKGPGLG